MTFNDHVSTNPIIGFLSWMVLYLLAWVADIWGGIFATYGSVIVRILGKYHDVRIPPIFMDIAKWSSLSMGTLVGAITFFEWLKKQPYFKRKLKKR